jgi:cyclohexanone monooxygenase
MAGRWAAGELMFDVTVVGAGFGGLHMLYRLRELGFSVRGIEAAPDVGGAWYWNRYPGARCDVESLVYSYTFSAEIDREWNWTERYAAQPEIKRYLSFVADRLELRAMIQFSNHVEAAVFDQDENCWRIQTDKGLSFASRFLVLATGPISKPVLPDIPGIDEFGGTFVHTARWPEQEPDFAGKKVGIVGTGSSGVQTIPHVAKQAEKLTVFLRTANFTVPARNGPLSQDDLRKWEDEKNDIRTATWTGEIGGAGDVLMAKDLRQARLRPAREYTPEQRRDILERRWQWGGGVVMSSFADVMTDPAVNDEVADFLREKIRETVQDPKLADLLTPRGFYVGTKRICVGTNYYETYNRDNVAVVDVKSHPIERITARGVVVNGVEHELDYIIFATGFDALTGALTSIEVRGKDGRTINEAWSRGPQTFLGLAVQGFPNMLMIGGPGSPSVLSNVVQTNEYQVELIARFLTVLRERGNTHFDVDPDAQATWTAHVNEVVHRSLFGTSDSWYVGANIPGKPRVILAYTGGIRAYRMKCEELCENDFRGFLID